MQQDFKNNKIKFYNEKLLNDTIKGVPEVHEFWRLLSICHTVMPERKNGNSQIEYQSQSPDDVALVTAARNSGFVFKARTPNSVTIESILDYPLLGKGRIIKVDCM
uniref:Uncharacterized protein n=1 Tax=Acrobeloides nanus TaxID=290746 RepID=A0A914D410_9BILA